MSPCRTTTTSTKTSSSTPRASKTTKKRKTTTRTEHHPVAFGLGGNQGGEPAVRGHLGRALDHLAAVLGPLRVASLYRTAPVSPIPQAAYLNTAAVGETALPPCEVLRLAKRLERAAGRRDGGPRDAPRPLDVDLLVYGEVCGEVDCGDGQHLKLPHPRLAERAFVLVPLAEVAPEMRLPPEGRTVAELLRRLGEVEGVERVEGVGLVK